MAPITVPVLVPTDASLACHYLSLPESPDLDPAGKNLEFPSDKRCTVFEFFADVVTPGLLPTADRLAFQCRRKPGKREVIIFIYIWE